MLPLPLVSKMGNDPISSKQKICCVFEQNIDLSKCFSWLFCALRVCVCVWGGGVWGAFLVQLKVPQYFFQI